MHPRSRFLAALLLLLGVFSLGARQLSATTYIVGTCIKGTTFTRIQDALNASPSPNVVEVCPGTYQEQVLITKPVTLEGVAVGTNDAVLIVPPSGGLTVNAVDDFHNSIAAQVLVLATTGVTVSNLHIDGSGANLSTTLIVGVFFEESSGTINGVATVNQNENGNGIGISLEGGTSDPTVSVQNCVVFNFDRIGIRTETNSTTSELTVTIKDNFVRAKDGVKASGLKLGGGSTVTATGNSVNGANMSTGANLDGAAGSLSGNIFTECMFGITVNADAAISVTGNGLWGDGVGIELNVPTASTAVQQNTIVSTRFGITFGCHSASHVNTNTFINDNDPLFHVPSGTTSAGNTYLAGDSPIAMTLCP